MKILAELLGRACDFGLVCLFTLAACSAYGQAPGTNANQPADADKAWKEIEQITQPLKPPPEWQNQRPTPEEVEAFKAQQGVLYGQAAEKVKDFYTRYPDYPHAAEARTKEYEALQIAVYLGNTNKAAALETLAQERLKDPKLTEEKRFELRVQMIQRALYRKNTEGEAALRTEKEKSGRELMKEFPKRDEGYQLLLEVAGEAEAEKALPIAKEVLAAAPSDSVKSAAQGLVKKLEALGKPLPIKFTAVDGREVDVQKLRGKVVLIDFWATWCGPCVAELPHVKSAYDKLHPKGFEIVGISFDADKTRLEKFVAEQEMKWPQYFDGKRWENKFGVEYGITSIPAMWLVDKKGNLRDMNARTDLDEKIEKMLAE